MYKLTKHGIKECEHFIAECNAKRKELLDAKKDTATQTTIPTIEEIESEIEDYIDEDGDYYSCWGVTDNDDLSICLRFGIDFVKEN